MKNLIVSLLFFWQQQTWLFLQDKIYFSQIPDEMMVIKGKVIN
jgi:hypothetical protein